MPAEGELLEFLTRGVRSSRHPSEEDSNVELDTAAPSNVSYSSSFGRRPWRVARRST